ncbi:MAG: DUF7507 domain-containing protein [Phycisphaerales bacterium]
MSYENSANFLPSAKKAPAAAPAPAPKAEAKPVEVKGVPVAAPSASSVCYPSGRQVDAVICVDRQYPSAVSVGQAFDYFINVKNVSGVAVDSVVVDETLPGGFTWGSSNPNGTKNGNIVSWNLGKMNPGETRTIKVSGTAGDVKSIASCATLTYLIPVCQEIPVVKPALAISKTATAAAVLCDPIAYEITVTNTGTGVVRNVKVSDNLPAGVTTADGKSTFAATVDSLRPGESKKFPFSAKASKRGTFANTASASADGGLTVNSNATSTVITQPELTISAQCSGDVRIGKDVTVKYTVTNKGDAACNTTVNATLTGGAFKSADNGGTGAGNAVTWNIGSLGAGQSKVLSVVMTTNSAGQVGSQATASCACSSPVSANCSVNVRGVPDLGTLVTDDNVDVVLVGAEHDYRVEVKNQGQVPLTNTKMVVKLPEGMTFVRSDNGKAVGNTVVFEFGTVAPGKTATGKFFVRATKAGELLVIGETTCSEIKTPVRDDELTNFVE